ncbi:MAG: PhoH family protein [Proteobacteria bacterium]|nr:PhoH family protein [Cystobacterineae bacterium]MCL2314524.1 PhoH family protein [Pseudomonadota bacterium]
MQLEIIDSALARALAGPQGENYRWLERRMGVRIGQRGTKVDIQGEDGGQVQVVVGLLKELCTHMQLGLGLTLEDMERALLGYKERGGEGIEPMFSSPILKRLGGGAVVPRTAAQKRYVEMIGRQDIVFGVGPAGTGKTYLAVAMAVVALMERKVRRIVLTRPAVEAGEKLGFLPGDLAQKVDPYLRPLYDALRDFMDGVRVEKWMEEEVIEVAPLAFMRGRTLHEAYAILDEAQNATIEQMKMFLTRLGPCSKAVITGDLTQVDLAGKPSGLLHARQILQGVEGIGFLEFSERDVVRHRLVREIIKAYESSPACLLGEEKES